MADKMKILIVDDDVNICETLKDILEEEGHLISVANDGEAAINIIKNDHQDIIFLDMKLPAMNGLGVCLFARNFNPEIPVVIMTAYQQELKSSVAEALKRGAYACIYKPFDVKVFFDILEEVKGKEKRR